MSRSKSDCNILSNEKDSSKNDDDIDKAKKFSILQHNPWNVYLGDCTVVTSYLKDKPLISLKWSPIHVINIFLRAVGQVKMKSCQYYRKMFNFQPAFVNNPLLGAIILAGLFLYEVEVGLGCILGGMTATLTDLVLSLHPLPDLNAGVASFNGVLVGTVIPILFPVFNHLPRSTEMWLAIFVGAITSAFLARAFGNFLSKFDVPYMALPFNLIAVCVFLTLQPLVFTPENMSDSDMQGEANITLEWDKVGRGIVVSMGQVYAVKELEPSIVINLAVFLSSPLLFLMSTLGATLSTLTSLVFLEPSEYEAVYDGEPLGKF